MRHFTGLLTMALVALPLSSLAVQNNPLPDKPLSAAAAADRTDRTILAEYDFESGPQGWTHGGNGVPLSWWHPDPFMAPSGLAWWSGNPFYGGYLSDSYMTLDTPPLMLMGATGPVTLEFNLQYSFELPGGEPVGYDAWDAGNVQVSVDDGASWQWIEPMGGGMYTSASCYSFGHQFCEGVGVPGWAGAGSGMEMVMFDLTPFSGQTLQVRWAACADPMYDVLDDPSLYGMVLDDILIHDDAGQIFFQCNGDTPSYPSEPIPGVITGQDNWVHTNAAAHSSLYSWNSDEMYCQAGHLDSPEIDLPMETGLELSFYVWCDMPDYNGDGDSQLDDYFQVLLTTDGGTAWQSLTYDYQRSYNAADFGLLDNSVVWNGSLDLSAYAGQTVQIRLINHNDDNDDGGNGSGLWIDDVMITYEGFECPPEAFWETEPNDDYEMANPLPVGEMVCGENSTLEDHDFFIIEDVEYEEGTFQMECYNMDGAMNIYATDPSTGSPVLVAQVDDAAYGEPEQFWFYWDPCHIQPFQTPYYVDMTSSPSAVQPGGNYTGTVVGSGTSVPRGDCADYPIVVNSLPYTDGSRSTANYRDENGHNTSRDVWYQVTTSNRGLRAKTCNSSGSFNSLLSIWDSTATTEHTWDDNSCLGSNFAKIYPTNLPGAKYFVVVEGSAATDQGAYTLDINWTVSSSLNLVVGQWEDDSEPWHQRFLPSDMNLHLRADDWYDEISHVDFYCQDPWGLDLFYLGTDLDGSEIAEYTEEVPSLAGDGWRLELDPGMLPELEPQDYQFAAITTLQDGTTRDTVWVESFFDVFLDPSVQGTDLQDWNRVFDDEILVDFWSEYPSWIEEVDWYLDVKPIEFVKGIPPMNQHQWSDTHCAPTAAAACLSYYGGQGDTSITGGLSEHDLIGGIAERSGTNVGRNGTRPSDLAAGLRSWIKDHGNGYTVRGPQDFNFEKMRSELERCQDVLVGMYWPGGGGHRVTMNSVVNLDINGEYLVDFMDPWTGEIEYGWLDSSTGQITQYADNEGYSNKSAQLGNIIYVCPKEDNPGGSGGGAGSGLVPWPPVGPYPIPLPDPGLYFLKIVFFDNMGYVRTQTVVVERAECLAPLVTIERCTGLPCVRLDWEPVPYATQYLIYRSVDPYFDVNTMPVYDTTTDPFYVDMYDDVADPGKYFYQVVTSCGLDPR